MQIGKSLTHTRWFLPPVRGRARRRHVRGAVGRRPSQKRARLGGRSETIRGLRGDGRDERFRTIDIHATAFAGVAVIVAVLVAFVVELGRGHDGSPYSWLAAVGGIAYVVAIVALRLRG